MTINIPGTQPIQVKPQPMMDHMEIQEDAKTELATKHLQELFKGVKDVANLLTTDAGRAVLKMADMEVGGKKCISAEKWNAYVAEKFPHVQANPVENHITLVSAMNSLTTYIVKEQTAQKAEEKAALAEKSEQEGNDGKAPDMGV